MRIRSAKDGARPNGCRTASIICADGHVEGVVVARVLSELFIMLSGQRDHDSTERAFAVTICFLDMSEEEGGILSCDPVEAGRWE